MRRMTTYGLVICLLQFVLVDSTWAADTSRPKESVNQLGIGANVKLTLTGGEKVQGAIAAIEDDGFRLSPRGEDQSRPIAYAQVENVKLAKLSYKASERPDPIEAKRVVSALGVGEHVVVKLGQGRKFHGYIQSIGPDHFTLLPDRKREPVNVYYAETTQVGKNLSAGATIATVVGIAAAVVVLSFLLQDEDQQPHF